MVYEIFDKEKGQGAIASVNEELVPELYKPVIKKFIKGKIYAIFEDRIWAADLVEMGSFAFKNRDIKYFLCVKILKQLFMVLLK